MSAKSFNDLDSEKRINTIITAVKKNKIIVLEEGLTREEERELFSRVMKEIGRSKSFTGIEIASLGQELDAFRSGVIKMLGGKAKGLTIVGPEKLVREIKRDPEKIGFSI